MAQEDEYKGSDVAAHDIATSWPGTEIITLTIKDVHLCHMYKEYDGSKMTD